MAGLGSQALRLIGFGSPFLLAAAAYSLFLFLDRNASTRAKRAVSGWIQGRSYERLSIPNILLDIFYTIYTRRLLSLDAVARSTVYSAAVLFLCLIAAPPILHLIEVTLSIPCRTRDFRFFYFAICLSNFVSDYASLFLVRWWLRFAQYWPGKALVGGIVSGVILIDFVYTVTFLLVENFLVFNNPSLNNFAPDVISAHLLLSLQVMLLFGWPAILVYAWLPLLLIGLGAIKLLSWFGRAAATAQWFLKQGSNHPLQAIGMVVAIVVFVLAGAATLGIPKGNELATVLGCSLAR